MRTVQYCTVQYSKTTKERKETTMNRQKKKHNSLEGQSWWSCRSVLVVLQGSQGSLDGLWALNAVGVAIVPCCPSYFAVIQNSKSTQ
jgi:hypothetical protein